VPVDHAVTDLPLAARRLGEVARRTTDDVPARATVSPA
jgi:hypothetical protein